MAEWKNWRRVDVVPGLLPTKPLPPLPNLNSALLAAVEEIDEDICFSKIKDAKKRRARRCGRRVFHPPAPDARNPGSFRNWRIGILRKVSRLGGQRRMAKLTAERRKEIARAAAQKRWDSREG